MPIAFYKKVGETPLESLNRLRKEMPDLEKERLSYAGRLDPLAEGLLLVLTGEECDDGKRQTFLKLEKEYEVEVLFGFSTDSFDLLGIPEKKSFEGKDLKLQIQSILQEFIGNTHGLKYPPFSSKTVKGRPLFELAKSEEGVPDELPNIKGEIKSIKILGFREISTSELSVHIQKVIDLVNGDFRQIEVLNGWKATLVEGSWPILKLLVHSESGVYMRSLANSLGEKLGCGALAYSIKRTKIGDYLI